MVLTGSRLITVSACLGFVEGLVRCSLDTHLGLFGSLQFLVTIIGCSWVRHHWKKMHIFILIFILLVPLCIAREKLIQAQHENPKKLLFTRYLAAFIYVFLLYIPWWKRMDFPWNQLQFKLKVVEGFFMSLHTQYPHFLTSLPPLMAQYVDLMFRWQFFAH